MILDYSEAEVSKRIKRIQPSELRELEILADAGGNENDHILKGMFAEKDVAVKLKRDTDFFLSVEAIALHQLQGVTCVPTMYGIVEDAVLTTTGKDVPVKLGIVTQYVSGRPIMEVQEFTEQEVCRRFYTTTGINMYAVVAEQLAAYFRGSLERRLFDCDVPERDIFMSVNGDEVQVTKIDQGYVQNKSDEHLEQFSFGENIPHKYDEAMVYLLVLPLVHLSEGERRNLQKFDNLRGNFLQVASHYKEVGLQVFPDLLEHYVEGGFKTKNRRLRDFPDDKQFLRFLALWEQAMEEHGRYMAGSL